MSTEYEVSIRIDFPADISEALRREKERFVAEYGSGYKSEPHITLYLDRYTEEGFSRLIHDLKELSLEPFTITLLEAKVNPEPNRHRNLFVVDISNKEQLKQLHDKIQEIAVRYHSHFLREKIRKQLEQQGVVTDGKRENLPRSWKDAQVFDPHITLGEVDMDVQQPDLAEVQKNIKNLKGAKITISSFGAALYGKQNSEEGFKMIAKVIIPFQG